MAAAQTAGAGITGALVAGALSAFQIWTQANDHRSEMVSVGNQIAAVIAMQREQCDREIDLVREFATRGE